MSRFGDVDFNDNTRYVTRNGIRAINLPGHQQSLAFGAEVQPELTPEGVAGELAVGNARAGATCAGQAQPPGGLDDEGLDAGLVFGVFTAHEAGV